MTGETYKFKVAAKNVIGEGPSSNYVKIALANPANKPQTPTINRALSHGTSLLVEWDEGTPGDIPILGYKLYMTERGTGVEQLVYNGSNNPVSKRFQVNNLERGKFYAFYVIANDFNSESPKSEEIEALVCVPPGLLTKPYKVCRTKTSIEIRWVPPQGDAG